MRPVKATKKSYVDLANVLIILSTFAGAVTLQTQFALPEDCNGSRVRALVAFSSQFFLMCPIAASSIYVALHNRPDGAEIETGQHGFLQVQFGLIGIMIVAGFMLLNVALHYAGARFLGSGGLVLSVVFILATATYSAEDHLSQPKETAPTTLHDDDGSTQQVSVSLAQYLGLAESPDSKRRTKTTMALRWFIVVLIAMEIVGFMLLLGLGITQALLSPSTSCQLM
jgi:hypothetical protein